MDRDVRGSDVWTAEVRRLFEAAPDLTPQARGAIQAVVESLLEEAEAGTTVRRDLDLLLDRLQPRRGRTDASESRTRLGGGRDASASRRPRPRRRRA